MSVILERRRSHARKRHGSITTRPNLLSKNMYLIRALQIKARPDIHVRAEI